MLKNLNRSIFKFFLFVTALFFVGCEVYHGNGIAVLGTDLNVSDTNDTNDTTDTNRTTSSYMLKIINSQKIKAIEVDKNRDEVLDFKNLKLKSEFNPQEIQNNILFLKNIDYLNQYLEIKALEVGKTILSISEDFNISIVVKQTNLP